MKILLRAVNCWNKEVDVEDSITPAEFAQHIDESSWCDSFQFVCRGKILDHAHTLREHGLRSGDQVVFLRSHNDKPYPVPLKELKGGYQLPASPSIVFVVGTM